jgi:dolichol-phosphate mannosyltransferase
MRGEPARVTVVVPTYQEAENIEAFLRAARAALPEAHLIVCDDGSPDGTGSIADEVGGEIGNSQVLHRRSKQGLGNAYRHGFRVALDQGADVVVQMDVDFSHPPFLLPGMVDRIEAGADVVIGSRYVTGGGTPDWRPHRRLLSKYGNLYARRLLALGVRDATSGLRAYRATSLEAINFDTTRANGYGFMLETLWRLTTAGCRIDEVPLVFRDRVAGKSKMSAGIMLENLLLVTWWGLSSQAGRSRTPTDPAPAVTSDCLPAGAAPEALRAGADSARHDLVGRRCLVPSPHPGCRGRPGER